MVTKKKTLKKSPRKSVSTRDKSGKKHNKTTTKNTQQNSLSNLIGNEIYLGLIAPIGIDIQSFQDSLENILRSYNYNLEKIKISSYLEIEYQKENEAVPSDVFGRKIALIETGDMLRRKRGNDYLAKVAISQICASRSDEEIIKSRSVYLINGFKHYREIEEFRSLYGQGFFLIGLHGNEKQRIDFLTKQKLLPQKKAEELIRMDQDNLNKNGQQLSESFHRADVFIPTDSEERRDSELSRFIDLIFGFPYHTPRKDEFGMFHAYAASLRSADLSRQVGAVITSSEGDILSQGANDVPKYQGGQYWADDKNDQRDFVRKYDSNKRQRGKIIEDIREKIDSDNEIKNILNTVFRKSKRKNGPASLIDLIMRRIANSELKYITEYGRAVHAEMAAITTASRLGICINKSTLFTTTFPCHNCAKHIIASGINRVVYIEPYPKSLAYELHDDALTNNSNERSKLFFEPFIGVGPRRFFDLFSMTMSMGRELKRNESGNRIDFESNKKTVLPRIRVNMNSIIDQEIMLRDELIENGFFQELGG